jgi:hypothetical protein
MNVTDERLKQRAERAISLQEQGCFILDMRHELPLNGSQNLSSLRYSNSYDEYGRYFDYETEWGKFSFDPDSYRTLLVLRKGTPPDTLMPQPRIEVATATLHPGFVTIHNNGKSFDLDFQTRDRLDLSTLRTLNQTLAAEEIPVVVWQAEQGQDETPPIIRIANDSAMLFASSAIWDNEDQQLVATQVVTTSQDLLKAIKATLAKNSGKDYLTIKTPDDSAYLKGARKGFLTVSNNLSQANAEGTVNALLHPLSGDPQAQTFDHFYLVITPEEDVHKKFVERLDLAIPWPLQPEWAEYLLEAGKKERLVEVLLASGKDFTAGLRILKNESLWGEVITQGLRGGQIEIS